MSKVRIAISPGDGIGSEIMDAVLLVFRAAGVDEGGGFIWQRYADCARNSAAKRRGTQAQRARGH